VKKIIIFGGTTEGRMICEWCSLHTIPALYCVAGTEGKLELPQIKTIIGRMNRGVMIEFLFQSKPALVIDATHPYADKVHINIREACRENNFRLLSVGREKSDTNNCFCFSNYDKLINWLNDNDGTIFVATGVKEAKIFTKVNDYKKRIFFRFLPGAEGLKNCLELGFPPEHLILMYGPFSRELNRAMFAATKASILVTKESGAAGGFTEKIEAARELGMRVAVIERPKESGGISVEVLIRDILSVELL
jgi:precorrin-6x reductase